MVNKNCVLAILASFVTMFVLGYVAYEPLLGGFFADNAGTATGVIKEAPVFWQIIVGQLCGATLLVCALSWKGVENAADGVKGGALVGLLLSLYFGFMNLGTMNTSTMNAALVDAVVSV
ncbi:MAG: hypothetical protein F4022_15185, partial [Gemmatimonadetes bacterium]|nr:hypothetical protein [Gemmatimonadota bacterium]